MIQQSPKKKVLFLITKSNWGGAQRYVYDLATALDPARYDVVVACGGSGELIEKLEESGVRTIRIAALQRDISVKHELAAFKDIAGILKTEKPDVFHVNSSKAGGIGAFLGRILRVPTIVYTAHGWAFNEARGTISRFVVGFFHWLTILLAHRTIAVSEVTKSQMHWPGTRRKMTVVHNGRRVPDFHTRDTAREKLGARAPALKGHIHDMWLGTIAELHPIKRHDVAIDAIAEVVKTHPNVRHIIIGEGELRSALTEMVEQKGLSEHVFFVGHVHEAADFLPALDIFLLTSDSEALAYAVIEAAEASLPSIVSRVGGLPEVVREDETGLFFERGNAAELQTHIETLIQNHGLRSQLGKHAKERALEYFSIERMVAETEGVYHSRTSRD